MNLNVEKPILHVNVLKRDILYHVQMLNVHMEVLKGHTEIINIYIYIYHMDALKKHTEIIYILWRC